MPNDISLTVRLPHELNIRLKAISKEVGMTRTNMIRSAVHDFLAKGDYPLEFSVCCTDKSDRLVLNINQMTCDILQEACDKHHQSMNAMVTAVSALALERASNWLQSVRQ